MIHNTRCDTVAKRCISCARIETEVLNTCDVHKSLIHGSVRSGYLLFLTDAVRKMMNAEFPGLLENDRDFL